MEKIQSPAKGVVQDLLVAAVRIPHNRPESARNLDRSAARATDDHAFSTTWRHAVSTTRLAKALH
jgi:hypothetical protein